MGHGATQQDIRRIKGTPRCDGCVGVCRYILQSHAARLKLYYSSQVPWDFGRETMWMIRYVYSSGPPIVHFEKCNRPI